MSNINPIQHKRGMRLIVAWMIEREVPSDHYSASSSVSVLKAHTYEEGKDVGEILIEEWSPTGIYVRVSSPGSERFMHGNCNGWYHCARIVVKEALPVKRAKKAP